ncbi:hypothetical protein ABG768_018933 [Culter alburnus]|uniref:Uncharacterized protein n=1 Tax=Culter alburnus TaxID=194366 RepID=A0AAW2AUD7_CULAL
MKKRNAERFYNLPFLPQAGQSTSAQDHLNTLDQNVIQPPTTWPVYQPPPTESFLPVQPQLQHATAWPQYQLPVSQSSPNTPQHSQHSPFQSLNQYRTTLSPIPHNSSLSQYSKHHQPHTALPTPSDQTQQQPVLADLDQRRQPPAPTAKESFLKMLHSPNTHQKPAVLGDQSQTSTSEHETSSSSADIFIIEHDPIPEREPCFISPESAEDRSWKPCEALVEEKAKLHDVLCGISGEHLEAFRSFLDKVEQIQPQAGVWAPKGRSRQQELYPGSGLFLSSTHLAAIHASAKKDCLRLSARMLWHLGNTERCQMGRESWISSKSMEF